MPIGYLKIRASTSRAIIPLEDVTVTIERENANGTRTILAVQLTDESGLTTPVEIQTPELDNSQSPNQPQGWSNVTIRASKPEYENIIVRNAQVFPDTLTEQEFTMIPLEEIPEQRDLTKEYTVPPQGL